MRVYLVRHGKTQLHEENKFQMREGSLSERGKKQADFLGRRLANEKIEHIFASDFQRTKETAEIINAHLQTSLTYSPLFWEYGYPSGIEGLPRDSKEANQILDDAFGNYHDPTYRHSDEEGFVAFKKRAEEALQFLQEQPYEKCVVVTHGFYIGMLVLNMLFGDELQPQMQNKLSHFKMTMDYTGITICEYTKEHDWRLLTWNDHAHLADAT